jgi:hypothetical protein
LTFDKLTLRINQLKSLEQRRDLDQFRHRRGKPVSIEILAKLSGRRTLSLLHSEKQGVATNARTVGANAWESIVFSDANLSGK